MSDYTNGGPSNKRLTAKNRSTDSDAMSTSSQNSESLDRAKEWRNKLETKIQSLHHEKLDANEKTEDRLANRNSKSQTRSKDIGPIFVSADDASTFDFPKQNQPKGDINDSNFGFKKTKVELQRNQKIHKVPKDQRETLDIAIPHDSSSVSSLSRDLSKVDAQNFGIDSILSRLQACAGTIPDSTGLNLDMCQVPASTHENQKSERKVQQNLELPQAHLAFLLASRDKAKNAQSNSLSSSGLLLSFCGRPDTIFEEDEELRTNNLTSMRSKVNTKSDLYNVDSSKMETRAPSSFQHSQIESSIEPIVTSGIPRSKSEKWQQFMDKRSSSDASVSSKKSHVSDISKAAEKFAAKKVEEIMKEFKSDVSKETTDGAMRSRSAKAAEYLAATRVQAMMSSYRSEL
jgi:hypothetical protein